MKLTFLSAISSLKRIGGGIETPSVPVPHWAAKMETGGTDSNGNIYNNNAFVIKISQS